MSEVIWARESFEAIRPDWEELIPAHYRELALYQDKISLEPDFDYYAKLDAAGYLCIVSGRLDGQLIGYAFYFVRNNPHYKSVKWAASDIYWLHPDHRHNGNGGAMFDKVEAELKAMGVKVMHTTFKTDHPAAGRLLAAKQHTLVEKGYSKKIG